jgi:hypothetical protein
VHFCLYWLVLSLFVPGYSSLLVMKHDYINTRWNDQKILQLNEDLTDLDRFSIAARPATSNTLRTFSCSIAEHSTQAWAWILLAINLVFSVVIGSWNWKIWNRIGNLEFFAYLFYMQCNCWTESLKSSNVSNFEGRPQKLSNGQFFGVVHPKRQKRSPLARSLDCNILLLVQFRSKHKV